MPKTILVSNRLPVKLDDAGKPVRTTGGLASALAGADLEARWVGWPGIAQEDVNDEAELRKDMGALGVTPVLLNEETLSGYYEGYSNSTIWPLLHYMPERARFDSHWFEHYQQANKAFAEAVLEVAEDGDSVWIHDYHLFLLPQLLRNTDKALRIAFFLHTPFPSSEIFRTLPERRILLQGLLGADLIGFHTYNYLRHFRSAVLRVLGLESEVDSIHQEHRSVSLGVYPIGHDHQGFKAAMLTNEYRAALTAHSDELKGKQLALSVERLDYTKGVPQKLAAIRRYLEDHPDKRDQVVFLIIAVPSRENVEEYVQLTEDVQREVGSINGDFGSVSHSPVHFLHRSFPQPELAALYALADSCLVTPLVDGMNLVAKEYIDCKTNEHGARPGALVLSEFAGAAQEMSHALMVNPYDVTETSDAIAKAFSMGAEEKMARTTAMQARLRRTDSGAWAKAFMKHLKAQPDAQTEEGMSPGFPNLTRRLCKAVKQGKRVGLFLDYDGTLRGFEPKPEAAIPDEKLNPLLEKLTNHPEVNVAIVSGRPAEFLHEHFPDTRITLVAEHGYRWRREGQKDWGLVHEHIDTDWSDVVLPLIEQAVDLTPGSHLEEKQSSIVWHYRQADPEFGLWRAHGLLDELTDVTANLPVSVHHGKKIVEVASQMVNKGNAVRSLITEWECAHALAAGDDQTDETMFALELPDHIEFVSIKVGKEGATRADRRTDQRGIRSFLEGLASALQ